MLLYNIMFKLIEFIGYYCRFAYTSANTLTYIHNKKYESSGEGIYYQLQCILIMEMLVKNTI